MTTLTLETSKRIHALIGNYETEKRYETIIDGWGDAPTTTLVSKRQNDERIEYEETASRLRTGVAKSDDYER